MSKQKFYYEREKSSPKWGGEQPYIKTNSTEEAVSLLKSRYADLLCVYDSNFVVYWEATKQRIEPDE